MSTLRTIVVITALAASTSAFAMNTSYPRAGSGGGPGRADFFATGNTAKPVIGATGLQRPAQASMVRSGNGGSNTLGGRAIARPFTPTPQQALNTDD
jgi:hypothetical protein